MHNPPRLLQTHGIKTKSNEILFQSKDLSVTEGRETFMPAAHKNPTRFSRDNQNTVKGT